MTPTAGRAAEVHAELSVQDQGADGPPGRPNPEAMFDRFDENSDGQLSKDEFLALSRHMRRMGPGGPPPRGPRAGRNDFDRGGPPPGEFRRGRGPGEGAGRPRCRGTRTRITRYGQDECSTRSMHPVPSSISVPGVFIYHSLGQKIAAIGRGPRRSAERLGRICGWCVQFRVRSICSQVSQQIQCGENLTRTACRLPPACLSARPRIQYSLLW